MFTGIVEELGTVRSVESRDGGARVVLGADVVLGDVADGASIAVNGCCLTVVSHGPDWWAADAIVETLDRTTLGGLEVGDRVNLERPLRLADRLGGHMVQGHVDGLGTVTARTLLDDGSTLMTIGTDAAVTRYLVEKGSITVDGVSLTIAGLGDDGFSVALIPHTQAVTTLGRRAPGDSVNLEVDVLAKYVERLLVRKGA